MDALERYQEWLTNPVFDEETKKELLAIRDDEEAIRERFTGDLEFGTGGLRGVIGAGINRMNVHTVAKARAAEDRKHGLQLIVRHLQHRARFLGEEDGERIEGNRIPAEKGKKEISVLCVMG